MSATGVTQFERLAEKDPLCHPGVMSMSCMNFDQAPPEHLREIYGVVYRALHDEYPDAPKKHCKLYPREHGKSETGSHVCPTWAVLDDPNRRVLILMETADQAKSKLDECRETINKLGPMFGHKIKYDNATEIELERDQTWAEPSIKAAGFGSSITGGHYDLIIFDDMVSWESQRTESRREKVWKQFQDYMNLGSEGETLYLVLGTRKHPDDVYSNLIKNPVWRTSVDKAIADWSIIENGEFTVYTVHEDKRPPFADEDLNPMQADKIAEIPGDENIVKVEPHRNVDVLWPERWPLDALILELLSSMTGDDAEGSLVWKRENQNDAEALLGQVLGQEMLTFVDEDEVPNGGRLVAGMDLALEGDPEKAATNDTDYWAIAILRQLSDQIYLEDVVRRRGMSVKQGVKWAAEVLDDYEIAQAYAESNQAQQWFVQTAQDEGLRIQESVSKGKKEDRILTMSSRFESGKIRLVGSGWNAFMTEWAQFPSGDHDDMLDAVEIALRGVQTGRVVKPGTTSPYMG